jgi:hypothetical protein
VEPFFQGVGFPLWISWVAPTAALSAAGLFSIWLIVQRSRIALQPVPRLPIKTTEQTILSKHASADDAVTKSRLRFEIERNRVTHKHAGPSVAPYLASPVAQGRSRSAAFRRAERRLALRRGSEPFPVQLNDATASGAPYLANILDRSKSGLCIAVDQPVAADTILSVRAHKYEDAAVWVQIRVRHCRQKNHQWLLGCSFVTEQPWSVLLMFG